MELQRPDVKAFATREEDKTIIKNSWSNPKGTILIVHEKVETREFITPVLLRPQVKPSRPPHPNLVKREETDKERTARLNRLRAQIIKLRREGKTQPEIIQITGATVRFTRFVCASVPCPPKESRYEVEITSALDGKHTNLTEEIVRLLRLGISGSDVAKLLNVKDYVVTRLSQKAMSVKEKTELRSKSGLVGYTTREQLVKRLTSKGLLEPINVEAELKTLEEERFLDLDTRYRQGLL